MSQVSNHERRFLVLVTRGRSVDETVEHALRGARDARAEFGTPVVVDVRIATGPDGPPPGLLGRAEAAVAAFEATAGVQTSVEELQLGGDDPETRTAALLDRYGDRPVSCLVVDSEREFDVDRLRERFGMASVEFAPGDVPQDRRRLLHPGGIRRIATIFGVTYLFYLAIGGFAGGADVVTGAISAAVVSLSLSHVALREEPKLGRTARRLARMVAFLPVLLWEIARANVVIAAVILHPRLPIDPSMGTLETDTDEGLERMVLANSITLTPGTLTIDVREREFTVHSLTAGALADLEGGRLPRLVRWVFHGEGGERR